VHQKVHQNDGKVARELGAQTVVFGEPAQLVRSVVLADCRPSAAASGQGVGA